VSPSSAKPLVRALRAGDEDAVHDLVARAFGRREEADLVRALRGEVEPFLELVAEAEGQVTGHIAFSPVTPERVAPGILAFGLGPMAVAPGLQRGGIGGELIAAGVAACAHRGVGLVFVLGHPSYYPRFGFEPAAPRGFHYQSEAFDGAFFLREIEPGAARGGGGLVRFAAPFEAV
jgi:putative acetyltransferase